MGRARRRDGAVAFTGRPITGSRKRRHNRSRSRAEGTATAVEITTQSIHHPTVAIEPIANALPEPAPKSVLEAPNRIRPRRSTLLVMLDAEKYSED